MSTNTPKKMSFSTTRPVTKHLHMAVSDYELASIQRLMDDCGIQQGGYVALFRALVLEKIRYLTDDLPWGEVVERYPVLLEGWGAFAYETAHLGISMTVKSVKVRGRSPYQKKKTEGKGRKVG